MMNVCSLHTSEKLPPVTMFSICRLIIYTTVDLARKWRVKSYNGKEEVTGRFLEKWIVNQGKLWIIELK